jgi:general L-amino acid transport system substrate-binding protein
MKSVPLVVHRTACGIGHATRLLLAMLALSLTISAQAGEVIAGIKARGVMRCGVSEGIAGFSQRDETGRWIGLDADFCRAVAAAVLGDAEKVSFTPLKSSTRFPALQAGRIDLLARNTTWTFTREVALNVQFPAVLFYDGQTFMAPVAARIAKVADLQGATVCVEKGTTHVNNLTEYFEARGLMVTPLVIDSASEVAQAFFAGRCTAYTSDASQLAAVRLRAPGGAQAFKILPERISKEPLAPVVMKGDGEWATLVRWVLYALIMAEEQGITRDNIHTEIMKRKGKTWRLVSGKEINFGQVLGVSEDWAVRAVSAVGNYGELYERNVGRGSPLKIERGLNRLWSEGGLMYAPPID